MPLFKTATGNHIHSKAQMRAMFASNPHKAEIIAHKEKKGGRLKRLPEKKHPEETIPKSEYGEILKKSNLDIIKEAAKLTAEARHHISKKNFAESGERYPIEDKAHARNALARVSQFGSPAEKTLVREKVHAKYPLMGK